MSVKLLQSYLTVRVPAQMTSLFAILANTVTCEASYKVSQVRRCSNLSSWPNAGLNIPQIIHIILISRTIFLRTTASWIINCILSTSNVYVDIFFFTARFIWIFVPRETFRIISVSSSCRTTLEPRLSITVYGLGSYRVESLF